MMNAANHQTRCCSAMTVLGCLAVIGFSTLLVAAPPRGSEIKISATVESPDIIAVRIRHDMCPFCVAFDPQYPDLIDSTSDKSVLFVTLDLTSEVTQKQAALLVGAMGLEGVWTGDMSKMGTITFVDGKTKEVLSTVHQESVKKVRKALVKAVRSTRSKG